MTPNQVADFLIWESRERGDLLTNLKLQKLLYYGQAWHLALKDRPIFREDFQAWIHGPVLPSQYKRFKDCEWRPILDEIQKPELDSDLEKHLVEILNVFGAETATALELMIHNEKPWRDARKDLPIDKPSKNIISQETMRTFYKSLR